MLLDASPGVRDNSDNSLVKILLFYSSPVHEDTHALRLHSGHDVKLVPVERKSHHWHTVINCLKYTVHAAVADEGFHVGMACRQRNGSKVSDFHTETGLLVAASAHSADVCLGTLSGEDVTLGEHTWLLAAQNMLSSAWRRREIGAKMQL